MKQFFLPITIIAGILGIIGCNAPKPDTKSENSPMQKELQAVMEKKEPAAAGEKSDEKTSHSTIQVIDGLDHLNSIIENTPGKLLVFDLYADWCMPCRMLAPLYDSLSAAHSEKASFFRVDVQHHQDIAYAFKVQSIPLIVFIKDKEIVHSVTGINPRKYYEQVLTTCSTSESAADCREKLKKLL